MASIFWFRRDLRVNDNHGLYRALQSGSPVICIFLFDEDILNDLKSEHISPVLDKRLIFIHEQLSLLDGALRENGSSLKTYYGKPEAVWREIVKDLNPESVFANEDYEPYAIKRDRDVRDILQEHNISFRTFKDQVIFEKAEVVKGEGGPYKMFTPYSRKWKQRLEANGLSFYDSEGILENLAGDLQGSLLPLEVMGFKNDKLKFPGRKVGEGLLSQYADNRDFPAKQGTSRLGMHLRFGTVSIRQLVRQALDNDADVFLNELIWREFYMMILWHFPHVVDRAFNAKYDHIPWRNDEGEFQLWCKGRTGYPIVDAGMRELRATGYMHNRVRMITASFLTKHLLIDWRWGEAWFAHHLLDYELASNNGGWQWAAGTGCDAAPYFRIFNPAAQTKKFDKDLEYISKWVPEFGTDDYPEPMVDHKFARQRALETYKMALG